MNLILLIITLFFAVTPAYAHLHGYEERETPYNINPPPMISNLSGLLTIEKSIMAAAVMSVLAIYRRQSRKTMLQQPL